MTFSLGISPCPNDTFIFYALLEKKIDHDFQFELIMEDIGVLNNLAFKSEIDVVKISFNAFSKLQNKYSLLDAGGALGQNCGPLLLSKNKYTLSELTNKMSVAIPGENTTANLLLQLALPELARKEEVLFSDIESKLVANSFDLGLVIHESRFTFEDKGLHQLLDLGEYWESTTQLPLPLGGIFIKKNIDQATKTAITKLIRSSIEYAYANKEETLQYCAKYAQEMNKTVMESHIDLYVNKYSLGYGEKGKQAIEVFLEKAAKLNADLV